MRRAWPAFPPGWLTAVIKGSADSRPCSASSITTNLDMAVTGSDRADSSLELRLMEGKGESSSRLRRGEEHEKIQGG